MFIIQINFIFQFLELDSQIENHDKRNCQSLVRLLTLLTRQIWKINLSEYNKKMSN